MPKVLLIVDSHDWAIGNIARDVASHMASEDWNFSTVSSEEISNSIYHFSRLAAESDILHWLDTNTFLRFCGDALLYKSIAMIHHIDTSSDEVWKLGALKAPCITVTDRFTEALVLNAAGNRRSSISIVRLRTSFSDKFKPIRDSEQMVLRQAFGADPGRPVILWLGNASRANKGVNLIREIVTNSDAKGWQFFFAGKGLASIEEQLSGTVGVTFLDRGSQRALQSVQVASLLVSTSFVEGGPLPVAEALGAGCRVISTDVGQVSEWISECGSDSQIAGPDPVEFIQKIDFLLANELTESERFRLSEAAHHLISWNSFSYLWKNLYEGCYQKTSNRTKLTAVIYVSILRLRINRGLNRLLGQLSRLTRGR